MSKEKTNRCCFDDWRKGIFEIDMVNLCKTPGDETGFEGWIQGFAVLDLECKSGSDDPATAGARYNGICAVFIERSKFLEDGGGPLCGVRRRHSLLESPRLVWRSIRRNVVRRGGVKTGAGVCNESPAVRDQSFVLRWGAFSCLGVAFEFPFRRLWRTSGAT